MIGTVAHDLGVVAGIVTMAGVVIVGAAGWVIRLVLAVAAAREVRAHRRRQQGHDDPKVSTIYDPGSGTGRGEWPT